MASIDQVSIAGFSEPIRLVELRETRCASVPAHAGIYLIEREPECAPQFLIPSTGGWFKGQDPNCALDIIEAKWVGNVILKHSPDTLSISETRRAAARPCPSGGPRMLSRRGGSANQGGKTGRNAQKWRSLLVRLRRNAGWA